MPPLRGSGAVSGRGLSPGLRPGLLGLCRLSEAPAKRGRRGSERRRRGGCAGGVTRRGAGFPSDYFVPAREAGGSDEFSRALASLPRGDCAASPRLRRCGSVEEMARRMRQLDAARRRVSPSDYFWRGGCGSLTRRGAGFPRRIILLSRVLFPRADGFVSAFRASRERAPEARHNPENPMREHGGKRTAQKKKKSLGEAAQFCFRAFPLLASVPVSAIQRAESGASDSGTTRHSGGSGFLGAENAPPSRAKTFACSGEPP